MWSSRGAATCPLIPAQWFPVLASSLLFSLFSCPAPFLALNCLQKGEPLPLFHQPVDPFPPSSSASQWPRKVETSGLLGEPEEGKPGSARQECPRVAQRPCILGWVYQAQTAEFVDHGLDSCTRVKSEESRNRSQFLEGWVT